MPAGTNLVVLKNDAVTNVTFTFVEPASGESPAKWQNTAVGVANAHRPELRLLAKDGSGGARRVLRATFVYPQLSTNSTTGITSIVHKAIGICEFMFPKEMASSDVNEFFAQLANLLDHADIQSNLKAGSSAT